ncbi:hypothetical protein BDFB_010293, partial [Asbolus verrucosus]
GVFAKKVTLENLKRAHVYQNQTVRLFLTVRQMKYSRTVPHYVLLHAITMDLEYDVFVKKVLLEEKLKANVFQKWGAKMYAKNIIEYITNVVHPAPELVRNR